jgi:hypothetical protein
MSPGAEKPGHPDPPGSILTRWSLRRSPSTLSADATATLRCFDEGESKRTRVLILNVWLAPGSRRSTRQQTRRFFSRLAPGERTAT